MNRFIRMPWDEPNADYWAPAELAAAVRMRRQGMEFTDIADRLAEAGWPVRDAIHVGRKLRTTLTRASA